MCIVSEQIKTKICKKCCNLHMCDINRFQSLLKTFWFIILGLFLKLCIVLKKYSKLLNESYIFHLFTNSYIVEIKTGPIWYCICVSTFLSYFKTLFIQDFGIWYSNSYACSSKIAPWAGFLGILDCYTLELTYMEHNPN